jgi:hypothetical protein
LKEEPLDVWILWRTVSPIEALPPLLRANGKLALNLLSTFLANSGGEFSPRVDSQKLRDGPVLFH